jgi:hypothetical protein
MGIGGKYGSKLLVKLRHLPIRMGSGDCTWLNRPSPSMFWVRGPVQLVILTGLLTACGGGSSPSSQLSLEASSPDQRADALISQMTLEEKFQLVHGADTVPGVSNPRGGAGWVPGIPRLNIPDLYLADGERRRGQ